MKPQTARDLIEAVAHNLTLDARCADAAVLECRRKQAYVEARLLERIAEEIRGLVAQLLA